MKNILFIISMHRSGSSLLTKGLEACDVGLGDCLMKPQNDNPKGFFEDQEIVDFNDRMLCISDYHWSLPTRLRDEIDKVSYLRLKEEARILLLEKIKKVSNSYFGIKDPRLCRLLNFWSEVCQENNIKYKIVFLVRNPNEISLSLNKREGIPKDGGYALWLDYMFSIMSFFREIRVDFFYIDLDSFLLNLELSIVEISNYLNTEVDKSILKEFVESFYEPRLIHTKVSTDIKSKTWMLFKSIKSFRVLKLDEVNSLLMSLKKEMSTKKALQGKASQLDWHRKAEAKSFRKIIDKLNNNNVRKPD